ncbi:uncharacterized protein Tco025E_05983 [Trypanosoma conorhini]|uniref:Uncharacterized protein n=1 Tax=Trypanosoma conorhini TaxID=83891 RepID=A0A3R7P7P0_9TRYP|nr:uncharacterized protein Tco025E_05983 [Trypanosoma conorhini]RNF14026.1 hypothetical protein Tco025E_05983 [Trypanosoma conorhini]
MEEESFTYVLSPAATPQGYVHRVVDERLPSLDESMEFAGKMSGTLLVDRGGFIEDMLLGFCRVSRGVAGGRRHAPPGGGIWPTAVAPGGAVSLRLAAAAPPLFQDGAWPLVWAQFQRDIARETLMVDGAPCSDASVALERIQRLLSDAYDGMSLPYAATQARASEGERGEEGLSSLVFNSLRRALGNARHAYKKVVKERKLGEAVRIAILAAQQSVMAFPVELLHAQFGRTSRAGSAEGEEGVGSETICIGEPRPDGSHGSGETSPLPDEEGRRMIVRIERRNPGGGPPFVRVEKFLHVYTVDEAANVSTKLQLWIVIELSFFTSEQAELSWEWVRPPGPPPAAPAAPTQPPEEAEM